MNVPSDTSQRGCQAPPDCYNPLQTLATVLSSPSGLTSDITSEARRHIRDFQRKRLYDAERGVPEGLVWDSLSEAQSYLDGLLASLWWQMHFPSVRCVVLFAQEGKYARAHKGVHGGAIQVPHWALNQLTLVHELAHLASPPGTIGHDPVFAGIYLLLVQYGMDAHVAWQLECHFSARRVQVQAYEGPRHHWFILRRMGVARQRIAARLLSVTPTHGP